jgi:hypothetical protein
MDPYDGSVLGKLADTRWEPIREALGYTRWFVDRRNLAAMTPADNLASTKYCLANPGKEYLVYLPDGGSVEVDLSAAEGKLLLFWIDAQECQCRASDTVEGGARRELKAPFSGRAVLYVRTKDAVD